MKLVLTAGTAFTPRDRIENPLIEVEDGRILSVSSRRDREQPAGEVVDFRDAILAPGLIDIHIHGGAGHDVMEGSPQALATIERHLARTGVTTYLPTTVTASVDLTLRALDQLATAVESRSHADATPLALHLEGPFISPARRGVHPPEHLLPPSVQMFERFWQAARGHISVMTIAPELPNATEVIEAATKRGVRVSIGHSDATFEQAQRGVAAGAKSATHTFNAMRPLDHREPGMVGAVLGDDRLHAELIADGVHVHPEVVQIFLRAKGLDRAVLVTDATSATGMGDGRFRLGGLEVEVHGDRCEYEGKLAGSVLTLDRAVRNIVKFAEWPLQQAVQLATLNPARLLGISQRKGILQKGADADLIVLSKHGDVIDTIIEGQVSRRAPTAGR